MRRKKEKKSKTSFYFSLSIASASASVSDSTASTATAATVVVLAVAAAACCTAVLLTIVTETLTLLSVRLLLSPSLHHTPPPPPQFLPVTYSTTFTVVFGYRYINLFDQSPETFQDSSKHKKANQEKNMSEQMDQPQPENHSRFLEFRSVPYGTKRDGELVLNRYSSLVTNGYEFPGAQAMLYAAGIKNQEDMRTKPQVGMKPIPALQEKKCYKDQPVVC